MHIKIATIKDINVILDIYTVAKQFMDATGNCNQWSERYPPKELILSDIKNKSCHLCVSDEGHLLGVFYFSIENDPTYSAIYNGHWLNDEPYGVIHRMASNRRQSGIADFCLKWCFIQCKNIRVDTHKDNKVMQNILRKNGFVPCGTICIKDGTERIAFHKCSQ